MLYYIGLCQYDPFKPWVFARVEGQKTSSDDVSTVSLVRNQKPE